METLKVKKLNPQAFLPRRATPHSAGADLSACIGSPLLLQAGGMCVIPTGIAVEIQPGWVGLVFGRSGLGIKHGIAPSNAVGVIDADYRGEVCVGLINHGGEDYLIQPGERIAQLILMPVAAAQIIEAQELSQTARGAGGLGSTGRQ